MTNLTQQRLKEVLRYEPRTGEFFWVQRRRGVQFYRPPGRISHFGYHEIGVDGVLHRAHRLAYLYMTGEWTDREIDHINRVRHDNRWANLRVATHEQNAANLNTRVGNTTGYRGVDWDKARQKWRAQIRIGGRKTNLGRFANLEDAVAAYDRAARETFGEFSNPNVADPDSEGVRAAT